MIFNETPLKGAFAITPEPIEDKRGMFARSFCAEEFSRHGLEKHFVQCNISYNLTKGTLRGMHYQRVPYEESKLVRCTRGRIFDVIVDLRKQAATFKQWYSIELDAEKRNMLYIPAGFAHGFQTLTDNAEVFYQMGEFYHAEASAGIAWNDPDININWPLPSPAMSERDRDFPTLKQLEGL